MAFIIDTYNKFDRFDKQHSIYRFSINEVEYAVKEVELFWGQPLLPEKVDQEQHPENYRVYGSLEEAMEFVHIMKRLN